MAETPEFFGQQQQQTPSSDYNAHAFLITQLINKVATAMLVKVTAVSNDGGIVPVGTVSVQPLVNQLSGDGQSVPHGTIVNLPYFRLQGGTNAVILDPQVDDIGVAIFCMRDISAVKKAKAQANPGSQRKYNWADGLYVGGFLNGTPEQYVQFSADGIKVLSPTKVTIEAPTIELKGDVNQTDGDVTMSQKLTVTDVIKSNTDVVSVTISGKTHTHPDPQGGNTGPPNP